MAGRAHFRVSLFSSSTPSTLYDYRHLEKTDSFKCCTIARCTERCKFHDDGRAYIRVSITVFVLYIMQCHAIYSYASILHVCSFEISYFFSVRSVYENTSVRKTKTFSSEPLTFLIPLVRNLANLSESIPTESFCLNRLFHLFHPFSHFHLCHPKVSFLPFPPYSARIS